MLRKFSNSRTLTDNIKLGTLTAFVAGMVNVGSLLIFLSFTSNVTGTFAILAAEISKGNWFQVVIVFVWIFAFFFGSFLSNLIIIHLKKHNAYLSHALPLILEMVCLLSVGIYGLNFYQGGLAETEIMLTLMLFAMGLQNGLTASISNFAVKTTHLTGTTTDLGILFAMFTKPEFRKNKQLAGRSKLLLAITGSYIAGAVVSGYAYQFLGFRLFFLVCAFLIVVITYDLLKIYTITTKRKRQSRRVHPGLPHGMEKRVSEPGRSESPAAVAG